MSNWRRIFKPQGYWFWNWNSGIIGGMVMGAIIMLTACIMGWW